MKIVWEFVKNMISSMEFCFFLVRFKTSHSPFKYLSRLPTSSHFSSFLVFKTLFFIFTAHLNIRFFSFLYTRISWVKAGLFHGPLHRLEREWLNVKFKPRKINKNTQNELNKIKRHRFELRYSWPCYIAPLIGCDSMSLIAHSG